MDRTLRVRITGDAAGAVRAFEETRLAADRASKNTSDSMVQVSQKLSKLKVAAIGLGGAVSGPVLGSLTGLAVGLGGIGIAGLVGAEALKVAAGSSKQLQKDLKGVETQFQKTMAPTVKPALQAGLNLIKTTLTALKPVVVGAAHGFESMAKSLNGMLSSKSAGALFKSLGAEVKQVFTALGPIVGNLLTTLLHLQSAAGPLIKLVLGLLTDVTAALARIDFTKVFGPLLDKVQTVLPTLVALFSNVLSIVMQLMKALSPIGIILLNVIVQALQALEPVISLLGKSLIKLAPSIDKVVSALAAGFLRTLQAIIPVLILVLPPLTKLIAFALHVVAAMLKWKPLIPILVATEAAIFLLANPIILVVAACAALALGIYELYKHWSTVWGWIKNAAKDAWDFLTHGWGQFLVPGLTLIRVVVELVRDHWRQAWDDIKHAANDAFTFIIRDVLKPLATGFLNFVGTIIHGAADAFGWVPIIGGKLKGLDKRFSEFKNHTIASINAIGQRPLTLNLSDFYSQIANVQQTLNRVGASRSIRVTAAHANVHGATGGIVNRPTFALIGEAGPEAVVPLDRTHGNGPLQIGRMRGGGAGTVNNITNNYHIHDATNPQAVVNALKRYEQTRGALPLRIAKGYT